MADYIEANTSMPIYMIYPRFLMDMNLNETEKLVYVVLLDRARLSKSNGGWMDENGHVFIIYPIKALAVAIHKSEMTIKRALTTLEENGLIRRKRVGLNQANQIYVRLPTDDARYPERNKSVPCGQSTDDTSDGANVFPLTGQKCSFSMAQKCSSNKNDRVRTAEQERGSKNERHAHGQFQNVFLTENDLVRLRNTVPNYREYIEKLSSYMASTGKTYRNHAATIQSWAMRDKPTARVRNYDFKEGESL